MSTKYILDNPQIDCRASYTTYGTTEEDGRGTDSLSQQS